MGKTKTGKNGQGKPLGFKTIIKPSKVAIQRHIRKLKDVFDNHKQTAQERLIEALNPVIVGWTNYYSTVSSRNVFEKMNDVLYGQLRAWGRRRHPKKGRKWVVRKYWREDSRGQTFRPANSHRALYKHTNTLKRMFVKVQGRRSPYDGDWVYWGTRLGRHPELPSRVAMLLKKQKGCCKACGLCFKNGDVMEVDHIVPKSDGGTGADYNLQLLHNYCHDEKTAEDQRRRGYARQAPSC